VSFANAQVAKNNELIQLSGLVVTTDSLRALPLVSIRIKNSTKGTYSDQAGFFSFVVKKGDTILFTSIGLKSVTYVVPQHLNKIRYSIIQPMSDDTLYLPETVIRPWPTPEEFNYYFVKANIPDMPYQMARRNLSQGDLQSFSNLISPDGSQSQNIAVRDLQNRYYYNGQLAPNRLFDPFAWGQFFNAWKRGDYKKK
jgi:hypothetical protein